MTLMVGIKCVDCVIVGADGGVTVPGGVLEPARKLRVIDKELIVGVSGHYGLSQLFADRVTRLWGSREEWASNANLVEHQRQIRNAIFEDSSTVANQALAFKEHHPGISEHVNFGALVALPVSGISELIRITPSGTVSVDRRGPPYLAVGSGAAFATPFLAFLRRLFFPNRQLGFDEGVLFVAWAIQNAIELGAPGVAYPLQIASLTTDEGSAGEAVAVHEFDNSEIAFTLEMVKNYERLIATAYRSGAPSN